jgi:hypothetical protein
MIFPVSCKFVGNASTMPHGEKVYFLTQYLIKSTENGLEILEVTPGDGDGLLRPVKSVKLLAGPKDIAVWEEQVNPHDRADLIRKAMTTGKRATIFGSTTDHMTFVIDPSFDEFETVHVFDNTPPKASLSETLKSLESIGYFEPDSIIFEHHIEDISEYEADVYPCRAVGFQRTLDRANVREGDIVAVDSCVCKQKSIRMITGTFHIAYSVFQRVDQPPFWIRTSKKGSGFHACNAESFLYGFFSQRPVFQRA